MNASVAVQPPTAPSENDKVASLRAAVLALQEKRAPLAAAEADALQAVKNAEKVSLRYQEQLARYDDLAPKIAEFRAQQIKLYAENDACRPTLDLPAQLETAKQERDNLHQLLQAATSHHAQAEASYVEAKKAHYDVRLKIEFELRTLMIAMSQIHIRKVYAVMQDLNAQARDLLGLFSTSFWSEPVPGHWQQLPMVSTGEQYREMNEVVRLTGHILGRNDNSYRDSHQKWEKYREALRLDGNAELED